MEKKKSIITMMVFGALVFGAFSTSTKTYANTVNQQKIISSEEANKIALKQTNNGRILKTELDTEKGMLVYEIEVLDGNVKRELEIDAVSGNILKIDNERTLINLNNNVQTTTTNTTTGSGTNISMEEAKKIALNHSKNGTIKSIEFDYEMGIPVYEIEVMEGFIEKDYLIDATNGNILKVKRDF
ncbi:MAG: PepSY domain-containing protein [Fusobacterium sp.]|uniref:PepSY domain-containing protein n=1 Tax=Fusobacterium sp. TaxID=68766 RepID=UPI0026DB1ACE|nr:PepSY domain-containing protein [Fusobacterium sp.]MDO4691079.1 PepSY domain-containing protein [Fusobacterium sp.]